MSGPALRLQPGGFVLYMTMASKLADFAAAQDAVQFSNPCPEPLTLIGRDLLDGLGNAIKVGICGSGCGGVPDLLLDETVPLAAGGAAAKPFCGFLPAVLAEVYGFKFHF